MTFAATAVFAGFEIFTRTLSCPVARVAETRAARRGGSRLLTSWVDAVVPSVTGTLSKGWMMGACTLTVLPCGNGSNRTQINVSDFGGNLTNQRPPSFQSCVGPA